MLANIFFSTAADSKDLGEYIQVRLIIPNYKYDSRTCCKLKGTKCPNATIYLDFQSERLVLTSYMTDVKLFKHNGTIVSCNGKHF